MMDAQFATPAILLLLPVLLALAVAPLFWKGARRTPAALRFSGVAPARPLRRGWKLRLMPYLSVLRWAALALLIIAAARPQTSESSEIVRGEGVDIALALDISGSMAAYDFAPANPPVNRLEAAKEVIADFIEQRTHDRIGLVVFASDSYIHSPPTVDHEALAFLLQDVELASRMRLVDGTAIGMGLASAANMLKDSEAKSKVVVLLTDGDNNKGDIDPMTAAAAAETLGIRVYTIGIGQQDGALTTVQSVFGSRAVVGRSNLDEETLRRIADATDGKYFLATDTESLRGIYDEINSLEKSEIEVSVFTQRDELAGWLLIPVSALILLEILARGLVFRSAP